MSLTDCVSIEVMRREGISDAIAVDEHFTREGLIKAALTRSASPLLAPR